ncbi:hypothetical protein [Bacteroides fragilis]|uniref:Uncharacterized protein n=1 Tax=Bacteroides fragilis str. 2-F-2 \|nr:hypothetical protein [Bacteroides fragilis]EXY19542.1 hypothetical protein M077_0955 [Bacteroides fragilis str. 2-F-2 \
MDEYKILEIKDAIDEVYGDVICITVVAVQQTIYPNGQVAKFVSEMSSDREYFFFPNTSYYLDSMVVKAKTGDGIWTPCMNDFIERYIEFESIGNTVVYYHKSLIPKKGLLRHLKSLLGS